MRLCLNRATLAPGAPEAECIRAAHEAGFGSIEISARRLSDALAKDPSVVHLLGPDGVVPAHGGWSIRSHWPEDRFRAALPGVAREMAFVASLGSRSGALILHHGVDRGTLVRRIQTVSALALAHDLDLVLEFIATSAPALVAWNTLPGALDLIAEVDRPNVGVLIDSFHWHASGGTPDQVNEIPEGMPVVVHLNDAPDVPRETLHDEMRLLPGRGVIDLAALLGALAKRGYDGPVSVELKHPDLHAMATHRAARHAFTAAREVLREIR